MPRLEPTLVQYGLGVLCVLVFVKAAGVPLPIPGDLLIVWVGTYVGSGQIAFPVALLSLALSTACGAFLLFVLVRRAGHRRVQHYGPRVGLTPSRLTQAEHKVKSGGWWAIMAGRTLPGGWDGDDRGSRAFRRAGRTYGSATSVAAMVEVGVVS